MLIIVNFLEDRFDGFGTSIIEELGGIIDFEAYVFRLEGYTVVTKGDELVRFQTLSTGICLVFNPIDKIKQWLKNDYIIVNYCKRNI